MECRMSIEKTEAAIEAILFTMGESVEAEKIMYQRRILRQSY